MQKEKGKIIIECYDKYGHKVKDIGDQTGYVNALSLGQDWEKRNEGNNVVISRILYNTVCNNDKWSYSGKLKAQ